MISSRGVMARGSPKGPEYVRLVGYLCPASTAIEEPRLGGDNDVF
jgi:hypothetical protein